MKEQIGISDKTKFCSEREKYYLIEELAWTGYEYLNKRIEGVISPKAVTKMVALSKEIAKLS